MKIIDESHPFYKPLWRRLALLGVLAGWTAFEVFYTHPSNVALTFTFPHHPSVTTNASNLVLFSSCVLPLTRITSAFCRYSSKVNAST